MVVALWQDSMLRTYVTFRNIYEGHVRVLVSTGCMFRREQKPAFC